VQRTDQDDLEQAAALCEQAAEELELAARHSRTAAGHFRGRELARAGAHGFAAHGHLQSAREALERQARTFAARSRP
jgi:hypothetical protein